MADLSQKHQVFPKGSPSIFPPTSPIKMLGLLEEPNNNHINTTHLSQFYQPEPFHDFPDNNVCVHETGTFPPQGTKPINNASSICTTITCPISSPNSDKLETPIIIVSQLPQSPTLDNKRRKTKEGPSPISSQSNKKMEEMKTKKQKNEMKKDKKRANEETQTGYIHVRARRGQATDSHSLAERVRREKISERMKILQGLVPGCDKVNGKALMLDEIINYVQSLQHQVEFLSMKLSTVNPMYYDFDMDIDTLMVTTEQKLAALVSPRPLLPPPPSMQPCNGTEQIPMPSSSNPLATPSIFGLLDNSASIPIHQELLPNNPPRGSGQHLWDFDDQIVQKLVNQQLSEFNSY